MLDVEVQSIDPIPVAAIRHVGPYPEIGPVFQKLLEWAGPAGLVGPDTKTIGVFYDDPSETAAAELRSDACVIVGADFTGDSSAGVEAKTVPGGDYAVGVLKGPYDGLHAAYGWLMQTWLPESGRKPAEGPCYEVYLNDCSKVAPEELLTAIHIPLQ